MVERKFASHIAALNNAARALRGGATDRISLRVGPITIINPERDIMWARHITCRL